MPQRRDEALEAISQAEKYLSGQRAEEAQAYALIAIAKHLDRIAGKLG